MSDIKLVQKRLLDMAVCVRDILEKEKIPYFITYGSLLGGLRHKGFIPWDDDFDFALFDDSYDLAIEALRNNLPENLFLEYFDTEPLFFHGWAHIKDLKSIADYTQFPQDALYKHLGLSLDLYRYYKCPSDEYELYRLRRNQEYFDRKKMKNLISEEDYALKIQDLNKEVSEQERLIATGNHDKTPVWSFIFHEKLTDKEMFPLRRIDFEGEEFYIPNKPELLLEQVYGDWKTLPPVEHRIPHYKTVTFL